MIALASEHVTMWWITLGLGLVVVLVVVVLLMLLTSFVKDVDRAVERIRDEAVGVAGNTASTELLVSTAQLAARLREEVGLHAEVLGRLRLVGSGSRS